MPTTIKTGVFLELIELAKLAQREFRLLSSPVSPITPRKSPQYYKDFEAQLEQVLSHIALGD